jgi:hypothetical protein
MSSGGRSVSPPVCAADELQGGAIGARCVRFGVSWPAGLIGREDTRLFVTIAADHSVDHGTLTWAWPYR